MLYLDTKEINNQMEAITYQNVWGLAPVNKEIRYVIGQSLIFPLLKSYPENRDLNSLANSTYFKLIYLDKLTPINSTEAFAKQFSQQHSEMRF